MVNVYLIMDDTGFDQRMWNNVTLKEILMVRVLYYSVVLSNGSQNGRQYNLDVYLCLQYMKSITASMRGQLDYIYIFRVSNSIAKRSRINLCVGKKPREPA